jgi:hypothetical protein
MTDRDCSASGDLSGTSFNDTVCRNGFCTLVGCSSDLDCAVTTSSGVTLHEFCVPPPTTAGLVIESAVTSN